MTNPDKHSEEKKNNNKNKKITKKPTFQHSRCFYPFNKLPYVEINSGSDLIQQLNGKLIFNS